MRKTILFLLSIGLLVLHLEVQSQNKLKAPGFLGKRTSVSYNIFAFPGVGMIPSSTTYGNARSDWDGKGDLFLSISHGLNISHVIGKRLSIGVATEGIRTGINGDHPIKIKAIGMGLQLTFFPFRKKGIIAPLGPYTRIVFPQVYFVRVEGGDPQEDDYDPEGINILKPTFALELGQNFIVNDRWMPSIGARYAIGIGRIGNGLWRTDGIGSQASTRLSFFNLLKIHGGIGYLF